MKLKHACLWSLVAFSLCGAVQAADNCKDPVTQTDMNICASKDYEREDALLNVNYKKLVAKLDANRKAQLKDVQTAWLKFRDLQCAFDSAPSKGGSIYSMVVSTCMAQLTQQRNKDLKTMLEEASL